MIIVNCNLIPGEGLEPSRLAATDFKSCRSGFWEGPEMRL